eukprot:TRINITY_DN58_c0_g2_i1.p1 TRINITY_DN58_c0_g2~~TRINITY_DN58_c0_g2_i1.p1  ORF type:complete len:272 (-),score=49.55 TRINITY_DN58_c0_g2_i1:309-1124(-)
MKGEIKEEVKGDVKEEMKKEVKEEAKEEPTKDIKESIKEERKEDIKEDIKENAKEDMKHDVKEDTKEDLGNKKQIEQDVNVTVHEANNTEPEKIKEKEEKASPANESDYIPDKEMPAKNISIEESEPESNKAAECIEEVSKMEQAANNTEETTAFKQYFLKAKNIVFKLIEINVQTFIYASNRVKDQYSLSYPYNILAVALTTFLLLYFILRLLPGPRCSSAVTQQSTIAAQLPRTRCPRGQNKGRKPTRCHGKQADSPCKEQFSRYEANR